MTCRYHFDRRRGAWQRAIRQWGVALPWLLPTLAGLLVFTIGPTISSSLLSFTRWDMFDPPEWIGVTNYAKAFESQLFWKTLRNTVYYTGVYVPLVVVISLMLAVAMNQKLPGMTFFRTGYFLPVVTSTVAVAVVWYWIYNPEFGLLNWALYFVGIEGPPWLGSTKWAMPAVIIMSVWKGLGVNMMIFLAGLQDVPEELFDAAKIDGAGRVQSLRHVTIPTISPTIFFVTVLSAIGAFQVFEQTYVLTRGGPAYATLTIAYYIFQEAFEYWRMGFAAALAWVLCVLVLVVTLVQFRVQGRWVHYG